MLDKLKKKLILFLLKQLGMKTIIDIYIQKNGDWVFLQRNDYDFVPRVDDSLSVYINEQTQIFKVIEVIIENGKTPHTVRVS